MLTAVVFILILGVLVLVHEAGHFFTAKRNGVTPEEFGFGFPPRIVGFYYDKKGKKKWVFGNKDIPEDAIKSEHTVYSLNWIPLGGFVKIKGEDGELRNDPKSFASQSIWVRFKILVAGVFMNVVLAVVLFTGAFTVGLPEAISDDVEDRNAIVQISQIAKESPAEEAGLKMGDEVSWLSLVINGGSESDKTYINKTSELISFIDNNKGKEVVFAVKHAGDKELSFLNVNIRNEAPEGQGLTGIEIARTSFARYNIFTSFVMGVKTTFYMGWMIFAFLVDLIVKLFISEPIDAQVAGPVGIAVLTGQMARMGLAFILQFAGMLSVNLAVINILPIPALDGGRIFFLLIEKIKGKPLDQKVEAWFNMVGFLALISLMLFVTIKDFSTFNVLGKIKDLF